MYALLVFLVAGLLGYFLNGFWLIVMGIILLFLVALALPGTNGGLESIGPLIIVFFGSAIIIGGAIGHFTREPPKFVEKIPPLLKEEKTQTNRGDSNLAETLKQLEEAGVITINRKKE